MEPGLGLLLLGLGVLMAQGSLEEGSGTVLEVEPPDAEVAVAVGQSRQFTCRLACPDGGTPSVRWRGLDTSLGSVQSAAGSSVLSVPNASLSEAGTRLCVGSCGDTTIQHTVRLLVYAFPDQLSVSPKALVPGKDWEVACTAHSIAPLDSLSFSLLLRDQDLEGVQALDREVEPQDEDDSLFHVTQRWRLPPLGTPAPHHLACQATMELPGLELSHQRAIPVLHSLASSEPPESTTTGPPTKAAPEPPTPATPGPRTAAVSKTSASKTPGLLTTDTSEPSTSSTLGGPTTIVPEPPASASPGLPTVPSQEPPTSTTREQGSTPSPCHPEILQPPASAKQETTWELLCEVACGPPGVAVHWTQAPGGLVAYEKREAGAQAWLRVRPAVHTPGGWFWCRVDPGGEVTSLYLDLRSTLGLVVVQPSAALWTGTVVLGLLLLAFLVNCLQKHCRFPA